MDTHPVERKTTPKRKKGSKKVNYMHVCTCTCMCNYGNVIFYRVLCVCGYVGVCGVCCVLCGGVTVWSVLSLCPDSTVHPPKGSKCKSRRGKAGEGGDDHHGPGAGDGVKNPLLEMVTEEDGQLWLPGNMSLVHLTLSCKWSLGHCLRTLCSSGHTVLSGGEMILGHVATYM